MGRSHFVAVLCGCSADGRIGAKGRPFLPLRRLLVRLGVLLRSVPQPRGTCLCLVRSVPFYFEFHLLIWALCIFHVHFSISLSISTHTNCRSPDESYSGSDDPAGQQRHRCGVERADPRRCWVTSFFRSFKPYPSAFRLFTFETERESEQERGEGQSEGEKQRPC